MAANPSQCYADDFLEQILAIPSYAGPNSGGADLAFRRSSGDVSAGGFHASMFPLELSLDSGVSMTERDERFGADVDYTGTRDERDSVHIASLFPAFGHVQPHSASLRPTIPQHFHGQAAPGAIGGVPHPPIMRPRVRARRGQATDPHSIAERLRRERIAERMRALHELVPSSNKTDRAAMLDEIVDYVKFLRLQVKVLSMSRLGGTGAVAQLVADFPLQSIEGGARDGASNQVMFDKLLNESEDTEEEVAKLMGEDVGAAMQFLQSKGLCIMPISLAAAIYPSDPHTLINPESNSSF